MECARESGLIDENTQSGGRMMRPGYFTTDYSERFAVQVCSLQAVRSLSVALQ